MFLVLQNTGNNSNINFEIVTCILDLLAIGKYLKIKAKCQTALKSQVPCEIDIHRRGSKLHKIAIHTIRHTYTHRRLHVQ